MCALVVLLAAFASACGSSTSDETSAGTSATAEVRSVAVGAPVSATATEVVLKTEDGERTFVVADEDRANVDPGHIGSHVGIANLGFRITYREIDGVDHAVAAEEVNLAAMAAEGEQ